MGGFSSGTTLADSQQNNKAATTAWVAQLNAQQQAIYDQAVRNFNLNMQSGQTHNPPLVPPTAPLAYVVSAPDANGYVWPVIGTTPLMPTPPLTLATVDLGTLKPPTRDPNHIDVGKAIPGGGGKWFTVGPNDGTPNGFVTPPTTSEDGVTGIFLKFGAPVGNGWYQLQ